MNTLDWRPITAAMVCFSIIGCSTDTRPRAPFPTAPASNVGESAPAPGGRSGLDVTAVSNEMPASIGASAGMTATLVTSGTSAMSTPGGTGGGGTPSVSGPLNTAGAGGSAGTVASASSASPNVDLYLGLAPLEPSQGFQVRTVGADLQPGEEAEYCELVQLPGAPADTYWVNDLELANGQGSHHLIVTAVVPGEEAEQKIKTLHAGDRVPCVGAEFSFGDAGLLGVGGIQKPYGRFEMAPGVGSKYSGSQYLIFDYHFFNATERTIHALSAANFHTTSASSVQHEALGFAFLNFTIDTPANASESFSAECHMKSDVMVGSLIRHTHKYGTDFDVWFAGGARDSQHIWSSANWEEGTQYTFPEPVLVKAGEGFRFRCGYTNPTAKPLRFGTSTADEMCNLFGTMWEAHDGSKLKSLNCDVIWNDDRGIGHPADEAGGIPPAPALTAAACDLFYGTDTECKRCTCESCGTPAVNCSLDQECLPILTCFADCADDEDCMQKCQPVLEQHPSAVGLLQQANSCRSVMCKTCKGY